MKKMWKIEKIGILLVKRTPPPTPHLPFPNILDLSAHLHYILDLSRMGALWKYAIPRPLHDFAPLKIVNSLAENGQL